MAGVWIAWDTNEREKTSIQTPEPTPTVQVEEKPSAPQSTPTVELKSDVGADYSQLQTYLAAQQFREADQETTRLMFWVTNRDDEGWLNREDIENFPCQDLSTIDGLWVKHSNGRFGFTVQKSIYNRVNGDWFKLADAVSWRVGGDFKSLSGYNFELRAPEGHLPGRSYYNGGRHPGRVIDGVTYPYLASRLVNCNL